MLVLCLCLAQSGAARLEHLRLDLHRPKCRGPDADTGDCAGLAGPPGAPRLVHVHSRSRCRAVPCRSRDPLAALPAAAAEMQTSWLASPISDWIAFHVGHSGAWATIWSRCLISRSDQVERWKSNLVIRSSRRRCWRSWSWTAWSARVRRSCTATARLASCGHGTRYRVVRSQQ